MHLEEGTECALCGLAFPAGDHVIAQLMTICPVHGLEQLGIAHLGCFQSFSNGMDRDQLRRMMRAPLN